MGDHLAALAAKTVTPPTGRVHLHLFIKRNGLHRVAVYADGERISNSYGRRRVELPVKTELAYDVEWRVSRKGSSVCHVPGRCILADIVPQEVE